MEKRLEEETRPVHVVGEKDAGRKEVLVLPLVASDDPPRVDEARSRGNRRAVHLADSADHFENLAAASVAHDELVEALDGADGGDDAHDLASLEEGGEAGNIMGIDVGEKEAGAAQRSGIGGGQKLTARVIGGWDLGCG